MICGDGNANGTGSANDNGDGNAIHPVDGNGDTLDLWQR